MTITTSLLLGLAWKSVLVASLALALLRLARSRSAAERSMIAHVGLAALLTLPAATLLLPQWTPLPAAWVAGTAPAVVAAADTSVAATVDAAAASAPAAGEVARPSLWASLPSASELAPWVYALPLALLFLTMLIAVVRLFAMRGRAEVLVQPSWLSALAEAQRRMGFKHGTALLVSDELRSPISWGVIRPTIVLSPHAVQAVGEAEAIIAHELAHVARLDWAKLLGARLACALFWFNPLVWLLARESHQLREEAADDAVLLADIDGPDYASLLVGAARHDNKGALIAAHGVAPGKDSLKRRITRVLDARAKRGPAGPGWIALTLAFLAGVTLPLAAFSATASRPLDEIREHGPSPVAALAPAAARDAAAGPASAAAAGKGKLPVDTLVGMKAMGVTPDDVREMRKGGQDIDADTAIAAKAVGASPAYLNRMRAVFPDASMDDLIGASAMGIDTGYAREMKRYFPDVTIDDLSGLRAVGVTGDYVREMRKAGIRLDDPDDAIAHRAVGGGLDIARTVSGAVGVATGAASLGVGEDTVIEMRGPDGRMTRYSVKPPASPATAAPPGPPLPPAPPEATND
ncbi:M56 family metallopeptidase [Sphingopyxis indica]|uniref:Signal transducer regulating beta-lactamase production, contains metallopeptidase domain n=1 Tax=Sphingopyxis indica TaxID=436663 RepID=A0A239JIT7_9SPHN|nr:M56 family metallopeptidase [Sphingopyxis indica]SNT05709.1 Signal transducer regulating beta-lactamase production, contains metallopeptidase domain [Sphingopyxis indica]